ncbi:SDR family NAD(P)-dependent oxidoreductase [Mycobacterium sp. pW045]|uniref:SDR family NAD(P)-dependent oxidoreductase n=1 Tax=Mycobacterium sp. pW045 TaxID=3238984 RepID=UPI00351B8B4A
MIEAPQVTYEDRAHPPRAVMIITEAFGIAQTAAAQLAAHGHLVLIGSRQPDRAERFAAQLRQGGRSAFAARLDFADPQTIDRFLTTAEYLIGTPDVLITDFGLSAERTWVGAQILATQVIPAMIANGPGDVVLVSPELVGPGDAVRRREFDAWAAALDAEFVGTQVRASTVRSAPAGGVTCAEDAGRLVASMITGPRLRLVELLSPALPA